MITKLRRLWCRAMHTNSKNVMWAGGPMYTCRRCWQVWENPMLDGSLIVPAVAVQANDTPALAQLWRESR